MIDVDRLEDATLVVCDRSSCRSAIILFEGEDVPDSWRPDARTGSVLCPPCSRGERRRP